MRITYRYLPSPPEPIGTRTPPERRLARGTAARADERARADRWEAEGGSLEKDADSR